MEESIWEAETLLTSSLGKFMELLNIWTSHEVGIYYMYLNILVQKEVEV